MQGFTKTILSALQTWVNKRIKDNTPDWNESNPEADGYVKNRPFYDNGFSREIVLKETAFTAEESYYWCSPFAFEPVIGETYIVTFDGKEYICTCYEDHGKCIGNAFVAYEGASGKDTGEPFFYYWYDSYNYGMCVRYAGNHTIAIAIEKVNIQKIDPKYLPKVEPIPEGALRPDYNIFHPNRVGYIKNRPCYYDGVRIDINEPSGVGALGTGGTIHTPPLHDHTFITGMEYRIVGEIGVKHENYPTTVWKIDSTVMAVDSGVYFDVGGLEFNFEYTIPTNTNLYVRLDGLLNVHEEYESFTARLMGEWRYRNTYVRSANIQFEYIHLHCYLVKELDDVMLPESIVSDWSQYNESSKNYIKNKTHYRYNIQDMPEFSFTTSRFDYFHGGDAVVTEFPISDRYPSPQAGPIPGYERTIIFDGVEYNCNLYSTYIGETAYYYGNASLRTGDSTNDTGEPFCWLHAPDSNQTWVITADTAATEHTISSGIIELKQLDEIYIPDTIARVADAEDENDAFEMLVEMGILDPIQDEENNILTDEDGNIFTIE